MLLKGITLLFIASTVFACEKDCRAGVSTDLANAYTPVIQKTVDDLESTLVTSLEQQMEDPQQVTEMKTLVKNTLVDFVSYATNYTQLAAGIHHVLFDEALPYKGDCNHPARLTRKMPPPGESWTMEECEKMDYRCGNPPSICHFLDDVKQRVLGRIRRQLTEGAAYDNGKLTTDLVTNIKNTLPVQDIVVSTIIRSVDAWANKNVRDMCDTPDQQELCNSFDHDVKLAILKWP
ncbi:hypothetical protein K501DRAFT_195752 [Backusella circina FSU 941]|nr:hypothetical protein K501DRAFT_195752 [Backusella circina FSU 941]